MSKMKISTKMMLWYTLLTTILLAIFLPILYHTIAGSLMRSEQDAIDAAMSRASASIEMENNTLTIQEDIKISQDTPTIIWNTAGSVIYRNTDASWIYDLTLSEGEIRKIVQDGEDWLVYDHIVIEEGKAVAQIRVCSSLAGMENTLRNILLIFAFILPVYFLVTIAGGLWIAKRSLRPIEKISVLAKEIELSDLSKRITGIESADEVGELAGTFNGMLGHLEQSFEKEKRFTSDASHELRTPVSVIMANAEAVLAIEHDEEIQRPLSAILAESQHMNRIITQLLTLTRGMEGKYIPNFEQTSLNIMIEAVLEQLLDEAEGRSIVLINESETEIAANLDQSLITQMLLNLVANAIKYGRPEGHVWVNASDHKNEYLLTVRDDGIGISPNELPYIFDRFYRVDASRDRSGSGLGLSIVKWIIDEHKGHVEVESKVCMGTTFFVYLNKMM